MKYEIVIFSSNIAGVGDPVVNALDRRLRDASTIPEVHALHPRHTRQGPVEDEPALVEDCRARQGPERPQLQPGHVIIVPPYTDATDKSDSYLEDITPFLQALVNEGVKDVPMALARFSSHDCFGYCQRVCRNAGDCENEDRRRPQLGSGRLRSSSQKMPEPERKAGSLLAEAGLTASAIAATRPTLDQRRAPLRLLGGARKKAEEDQKVQRWRPGTRSSRSASSRSGSRRAACCSRRTLLCSIWLFPRRRRGGRNSARTRTRDACVRGASSGSKLI